MSKKSYKRLQNRLYREIKRRMIAEAPLLKPIQIVKREVEIKTFGAACTVPNEMLCKSNAVNFIKSDLARKIATQLIAEDCIKFHSFKLVDGSIGVGCRATRYEARIQVVKPSDELCRDYELGGGNSK